MKRKTKHHHAPARKAKPVRRNRPAKQVTTAIVHLPPPKAIVRNKERLLTGEEITLIKNTVAKGTTEEQFALYHWICKKHRMDPLTKEIYCVLFDVSKHHQDEKGIWCSGKDMVVITG